MRLIDKLDVAWWFALAVIAGVIVVLVLNDTPQWIMVCVIVVAGCAALAGVASALGAVERTRLDRERGRDGRQ